MTLASLNNKACSNVELGYKQRELTSGNPKTNFSKDTSQVLSPGQWTMDFNLANFYFIFLV